MAKRSKEERKIVRSRIAETERIVGLATEAGKSLAAKLRPQLKNEPEWHWATGLLAPRYGDDSQKRRAVTIITRKALALAEPSANVTLRRGRDNDSGTLYVTVETEDFEAGRPRTEDEQLKDLELRLQLQEMCAHLGIDYEVSLVIESPSGKRHESPNIQVTVNGQPGNYNTWNPND